MCRRPDRVSETTTYRNIIYRLLPGSRENARRLAGQAGACRFVWNEMPGRHNAACEAAKESGDKPPSVSFFSPGTEFTALRNATPWLSGYSFHATRHVLKYQADAWKAFFRGEAEPPRFRSTYGTTPSFTIPDTVRISGAMITVPRTGPMRIRRRGGNPYPDGKPVKAVIRKIAGKWYVTVCYAVEAEERSDNGILAGVDMNVGQVAVATSAGEAGIIPVPDTGDLDTKIGRSQRRLARQRKGSRRRMKTKLRLQRLQRKRANRRKNWQHQASRRIAAKAGTVFVENLNTAGMTRSARGTLDSPGTNVKARSGLSREMLGTGWHGLKQKLSDTCAVEGVDPADTSQTCNACGHIHKASRRTQSDFMCMACGHADNADLNAARNIMASGLGASARRGAFASATPVTRETDRKLAARSVKSSIQGPNDALLVDEPQAEAAAFREYRPDRAPQGSVSDGICGQVDLRRLDW